MNNVEIISYTTDYGKQATQLRGIMRLAKNYSFSGCKLG